MLSDESVSVDTKTVQSNPIESSHDLTCPITLQVFRDPVRAGDGHVYERTAIVRWISENGISPFTRQPLQVDDLKSDEYLKSLAAKHRHSTSSLHGHNEIIIFPPVQTSSLYSNRVEPIIHRSHQSNRDLGQFCNCRSACIVVGVNFVVLAAIFVLIFTVGLK